MNFIKPILISCLSFLLIGCAPTLGDVYTIDSIERVNDKYCKITLLCGKESFVLFSKFDSKYIVGKSYVISINEVEQIENKK